MRSQQSWLIPVGVLIALLILQRQIYHLPPVVRAVLGLVGAGWIMQQGLLTMRQQPRRGSSGQTVQYWRGQRYVLDNPQPTRSAPSLQTAIGIGYIAIGGLIAVALVWSFIA